MAEITILKDGYAFLKEDGFMYANCTCTVVVTPKNKIIIDTMTPWDGEFILNRLKEMGVEKDTVTYCVSTHGHPDHTGNNNLFLSAKHIVGFCIEEKDQFYMHPFEHGENFVIDEWVSVTPSPGHTNEDVSLLVKAKDDKVYAVAGDLFESEKDTDDPTLWTGNSFDVKIQAKNRLKILQLANYVIPGHGLMFEVTPKHVEAAEKFLAAYENKSNQE